MDPLFRLVPPPNGPPSAHSASYCPPFRSLLLPDILGWSGDKQLAYPAQLAKEILERGVRVPPLRGEIYAQLVKQLSANRGGPESVTRLWQLVHLCLSYFPPSPECENYFEAWLRAQGSAHRGALMLLHERQFRGVETAVPNAEELLKQASRDYSQTRAAVTTVSLATRRTSIVRRGGRRGEGRGVRLF